MLDLVISCLVLLLLCLSALGGRSLVRILPVAHRGVETTDFIRLASGLLVTFTALVLSLLITTMDADFRKTDRDLRSYAAAIVILDTDLDAYGPDARPIRALLRRYTAAAIASTWPAEPAPPGDYPKATPDGPDMDALVLGDMLHDVQAGMRQLSPKTGAQDKVQADGLTRMAALLNQRWDLIGEARSTVTPAFFLMMLFWLVIVFVSFGMTAPQNAVTVAFIVMVGVSVACAIFVILELDGPLDGLIQVTSEPMRHALRHLDGVTAIPKA